MAQPAASIPSESASASTELQVRGMTCSNCARHVTEAIQSVPGVARAEVSLENGRAVVHWRSDSGTAPARVLEALKKEGYPSKPVEEGAKKSFLAVTWKTTVLIGVIGTVPLMAGEWMFGLAHES